MRKFTYLLLPLILSTSAWAESWDLPMEISSDNTRVRFEVDSTWHLIKGKVKELSGKVWLANSQDPLSIRAELLMPVGSFDTDNESRDERMREVMHSDRSPTVRFEINSALSELCGPDRLELGRPCKCDISGSLTIDKVSKPVTLKSNILSSDREYKVSGKASFNWADFGVEDPSILVAKLDPLVTVRFSIMLPKTAKEL